MKAIRIAKWLAIGAIAVVVAGVAILWSTDFGAYKSYAEEAVANATGRKLTIDGPVRLDLLPTPSLVAERVRFANAPWGSRPEMATVGRVEARVALWPLLNGQVVVKRLVLDRPDILFETDKAGHGNWQMAAAGPAVPPSQETAPGKPPIPVLDDVLVKDARFTWRDGATGHADTVGLDRLTIKGKGPGAPLDVALSGKIDGRDFAVAGRVARSDSDDWSIHGLRASYGANTLDGDLALAADAAPLRITGSLATKRLDLAALASGEDAARSAPPDDRRIIPDAPLPLDALHGVDADLTLTAKQVVSGPLALDDATVHAMLKDGRLALRPIGATLAGGSIDGAATLDGTGRLTVRLAAKNVDMAQISVALGEKDVLAAKAGLDVRLAGRGRTLRAVAADLDGTVGVVLGKGTIGSAYVNLAGADVIRTLLPTGGTDKGTKLDCFVAPFTVTKGVAKTDAILLDTDRMTVHGGGTVSLRDETIDLLLKPTPKDAALVSLATPIRVGGTLASPSAFPDPTGVVKGVAGAVAGAALGPIGLLLPLVSGGSGDRTPCLAALHPAAPKQAPAPAKGDSGPGGVLRDIGNGIESGIKGLFGR